MPPNDQVISYPGEVRRGRRRRLQGTRGRGTLATEKPPIVGMIQRGGDVVMRMLEHVQHITIKPLIHATMAPGTCVCTRMNTTSRAIWTRGAMSIRASAMAVVHRPEMTTRRLL